VVGLTHSAMRGHSQVLISTDLCLGYHHAVWTTDGISEEQPLKHNLHASICCHSSSSYSWKFLQSFKFPLIPNFPFHPSLLIFEFASSDAWMYDLVRELCMPLNSEKRMSKSLFRITPCILLIPRKLSSSLSFRFPLS
jgi:hypothetical protein